MPPKKTLKKEEEPAPAPVAPIPEQIPESCTESESEHEPEPERKPYRMDNQQRPPRRHATSAALSYNYNEYRDLDARIKDISTIDLLRVLIVRSYDNKHTQLVDTLKQTARAMNFECNFPILLSDSRMMRPNDQRPSNQHMNDQRPSNQHMNDQRPPFRPPQRGRGFGQYE